MDELIATANGLVGEFQLSNEWTTAGAVGAALITDKGNVYTGINVDLQCGIGFCAEHSAVASMLGERETRIEMIVAVTSAGVVPPCGRCREMLIQLNAGNAETKVIVDAKNWMHLSDLLPNHWL
ncbi:MAG: cytidine deaminase [Rhodothermales bacterium]